MLKRNVLLVSFLLLVTAVTASNATNQPIALKIGPHSWIDAPLNGSNVPLAPVQVISHATDVYRIVSFELSVNGQVVRTDPNPDANQSLVTVTQTWSPNAPGNYTLAVRALNSGSVWGEYARALITVGGVRPPTATSPAPVGEVATPTLQPRLPIAQQPTATRVGAAAPRPPILVAPIDGTAVDCGRVTLTWKPAEDPSAIRDYDIELEKLVDRSYVTEKTWNNVRADSTFFDASCDTHYRWRARATSSAGTQSDWSRYGYFRVKESVSARPTPTFTPQPRDKQAPRPPTQIAPVDGVSVNCVQVSLTWRPATDSSGIRDYDVELEKLVDRTYMAEKTWNNVRGDSAAFDPTCGTQYRWRVRATDNAGNQGVWSEFQDFGARPSIQ